MTQEEYNQLDSDFAHCAGTHCEKAGKCLRHTAYKMLAGNGNETYTMVNPAVIKGAQPCPFFESDRKERFAWGIRASTTMCGLPTCAVSDMKSWHASASQPVTMSVSNVVSSQKRNRKPFANRSTKWATMAMPLSLTAMRNPIPR